MQANLIIIEQWIPIHLVYMAQAGLARQVAKHLQCIPVLHQQTQNLLQKEQIPVSHAVASDDDKDDYNDDDNDYNDDNNYNDNNNDLPTTWQWFDNDCYDNDDNLTTMTWQQQWWWQWQWIDDNYD